VPLAIAVLAHFANRTWPNVSGCDVQSTSVFEAMGE